MTEKESKIRLGKVEVKMGEKSVSLTIDQARELCALLKGLFGDDATKIVHVKDYFYVRPWYAEGPKWDYQGIQWNGTLTYPTTGKISGAIYTNNCSAPATMSFSLK
jgi:hypothetical protein